MKKSILLLLLLSSIIIEAKPDTLFTPITSGYGANGNFSIRADKFSSPLYTRENVYVFRPEGAGGPVPVIFFAPGYNNNDPKEYITLIEHIVSRGMALVYTPFQIVSGDITLHEKRYDTIWAGIEKAVELYGESFDLERVGYAGHSYGAAASPAMALRGVQRRGWGNKALMLYLMAPWYYNQVSTKDFVNFPKHAKMIVQVYEDDSICDHRIGKEIFDRANLPSSEKEFIMLMSEKRLGYDLDAEHGTPSMGSDVNALDYYGIFRIFDALADYAFNNNPEGKLVALGKGSKEQKFMGMWPDGRPVREMQSGDCIKITRSSLSFLFPHFGSIPGLSNVSAGSLKPAPLAPDSLVAAWGTNFSEFPLAAIGVPPVELNGTILKVKDGFCYERLAPLFFVSPTQVNYLVPSETVSGSGAVTIFNSAGAISTTTVTIEDVSPSLFAANANGQGPAAVSVLRIKADGSRQYEKAVQFDFTKNEYVSLPIDMSNSADDVYLLLFGTGTRYRSSLGNVTATIGGVAAQVLYIGAQGQYLGLDQINIRVPKTLAGRGEVDIRLQVDNKHTNVVKVKIQ